MITSGWTRQKDFSTPKGSHPVCAWFDGNGVFGLGVDATPFGVGKTRGIVSGGVRCARPPANGCDPCRGRGMRHALRCGTFYEFACWGRGGFCFCIPIGITSISRGLSEAFRRCSLRSTSG